MKNRNALAAEYHKKSGTHGVGAAVRVQHDEGAVVAVGGDEGGRLGGLGDLVAQVLQDLGDRVLVLELVLVLGVLERHQQPAQR